MISIRSSLQDGLASFSSSYSEIKSLQIFKRRLEFVSYARLLFALVSLICGFGNVVSSAHIIAIVSPESAPIKRIVQEARDRGMLVDATYGRRTRAVLVMDSGHVVLSAILPDTAAGRLDSMGGDKTEDNE